jgi:cytochrome c-type biogenesis protein CcmH
MTTFIAIAACMSLLDAAVIVWPLLRNGRNRWVPLASALSLLALSAFLYTRWSTWDWSGLNQMPPEGPDVQAMVGKLESRLESNPDDLPGWLMLGRSYLTLERFDDAIAAYDHAIKLGGGKDAEAALGMGEAISMRANGQIIPPAAQLFETALQLAPQNPKALLFGGFTAANRGDKALARSRWETLKAMNPPPQLVQMLDARIAALDGMPAAQAADETTPESNSSASVEANVTVRIAPALKGRANPDAVVFVFASEPGVRGPPLAAKRLRVADIGASIKLSAADAMIASRTLRAGQKVTITARISFSGQPTPTAGDLYGELTYDIGKDSARELIIDRVTQ